jgi:hypothetical protein
MILLSQTHRILRHRFNVLKNKIESTCNSNYPTISELELLLEALQASLFCPSDTRNMSINISVAHWCNDDDR